MGVNLPSEWKLLLPHRDQSAIWRSSAKLINIVAGRGSGKTEISRRYSIRMLPVAKPWGDPKYVIGLPTYNQAKRVVWPQLEALMPKHWVAKKDGGEVNKSELFFKTKFGSTLFVVGMDKPHRIEGIQVDGFILDESSDQKPGVMKTVAPMLTHRNGFCWRIGVPKRTGCGAKEFREDYEKGLRGEGGRQSYSWRSDTVLTPAQLADALAMLSEEDAEEQIGGVWLDAGGAIFHAYNESINVSEIASYKQECMIGVGCDFNVNPMAWCLFHVIDGKMYVFDELYIKDTNTQATLDILWNKYGGHKNRWYFFGDASARARKTSASSTDYIQILNDKRFDSFGTKKVFYPKANPRVNDRFAACNGMLRNAQGVVRLYIHPKCKNLRADLQARTYKEGTTELPSNERELGVGHITDALGYAVYKLFAIRVDQTDTGRVFSGAQTKELS